MLITILGGTFTTNHNMEIIETPLIHTHIFIIVLGYTVILAGIYLIFGY